MRTWRVVLCVALGGPIACGLGLSGSAGSDGPLDGGTSGADASIADGTTDPESGSADDAAPGSDAGVDANFECPDASTTFTGGTLTVPPAAAPVAIDGDLSEWKCARYFTYDAGTAAVVSSTVDPANVYSFAVAWDPGYVYVAAHVLDATLPRGTYTGSENYKNDAVEVFHGGDDTFTASYTTKDHQYVVDWANRAYVDTPTASNPPPAGFLSAAKSSATGFDIEMRIPASEVGRATLAASTKLGFAFAADEGNGTNPHGWALWYQPTGIVCAGCCQVWCNAVYFGGLVLGP